MAANHDVDVTVGPTGKCTVRYASGQCPHAATPGLPVCGPCLALILSEPDPGRRRSLATLPGIPAELINRLAMDPDPGVRVGIAARVDIDPELQARFADPQREPSPIVWRNLAATRTGALHAATLATTGDRLTLLALTTNPNIPADVAASLSARGDTELTSTLAATAEGRPPDEHVISELLEARAIRTRSLIDAPAGLVQPSWSAAGPGHPPAPTDDAKDRPASHRLLVAGFILVLVLIAAAAVIILTRGGEERPSLHATGPATTIEAVNQTPPSVTSNEADDPEPEEEAAADATTLVLNMTAGEEQFCDAVDLTIDYEAEDVSVVITDDDDRVLFDGTWPPGTTNSIDVVEPSSNLYAEMTTTGDPNSFHPSGSVSGNLC